MDKDFFTYGRSSDVNNIAKFNAFNNVIMTFPPQAELFFPLAQSLVIFGENANEELTPKVLTISATYEYRTAVFNEETTINLDQYHSSQAEPDPLIEMLGRIGKSLFCSFYPREKPLSKVKNGSYT